MIVVNIIFLIINIILCIKVKKLQRNNLQDKKNLAQQKWECDVEKSKYDKLLKEKQEQKKQQTELLSQKKDSLKKLYQDLQKQYKLGYINYAKTIDTAYSQKEQQFLTGRAQLERSLAQIRDQLSAVAAAKQQEEAKQADLDFYKIQITDKQKRDIKLLEEWKDQISDPSIVSKIIWSSCIIKPTGDLCNRLTEGKTICGIYKITSLVSGKCYIGQSVNISERFKQHIKCGLGIDASATNKLYNLMQREGVYNFTFEILQKCSRDKLNERERFWIQTYQSDKFGMNTQGGNKT